MSDGMDPRHADANWRERESRLRSREMPIQAAANLGARLCRIIQRGVITPPSVVDVSAIKQAIQEIAIRVAQGEFEPCPSCQKDGVPTGTETYYDDAGIYDTRDCETCHGWTVVRAAGRNRNERMGE